MKDRVMEWYKTRYRIVKDNYLGYEVQYKVWWLPFWFQCGNHGPTNTHKTIKEAEAFAKNKAKPFVKYVEV